MPISDYLAGLRGKVGHDLLVLPSASVAVIDDRMRVLVGLHADRDMWVVPGGLVEPGEIPADAAVREVWEETGLFVAVTSILGVYGGPDMIVNYHNGDRASYIGTMFRGHALGGAPRADGEEILDLKYVSYEELLELPHPRWMSTVLAAAFPKESAAAFQPPSWRPPGF